MIIQEIVRVNAPRVDGIAVENFTPFSFSLIQTDTGTTIHLYIYTDIQIYRYIAIQI